MDEKKRDIKCFFLLLLFLFLGASFIYAQKPLEVTYPQIPGALTPTTTKTALPDYIRYVFQLSLFAGALVALGSFIYGGVRYLISAGSPIAQKIAQSQISAGILGLIILVSAYIILNTINPQLVAFQVSLPSGAPNVSLLPGSLEIEPTSLLEIPLGGLVENLWGKRKIDYPLELAGFYEKGFKPTDCYDFDLGGLSPTGDATVLLANNDRLDCIQKLSESIRIKGEKLKEAVEELQKLYDCQNCCRDCCKNVCDSFIIEENGEMGWQNCSYSCCKGGEWILHYYYQKCPYCCCEFFEECTCRECGFDCSGVKDPGGNCNCICVRPDGQCCNPENSARPYEDLLVRALIDENLIEPEETDPYPDISSVKQARKELKLKLGPFQLFDELQKPENLDVWLADENTQNLIKKILLGDPDEEEFTTINEEKLKEILKIEPVMRYLIEEGYFRNLFFSDENLAKIALISLELLKNEVAINEISWMGTRADSNQEWIELYNNTENNIDISGWKLAVKDKFEIGLSGNIPGQGFGLLENNENAVSDIAADLIYSGNLSDSGETLLLYDEFNNLADSVNCSSGWFAGEEAGKVSMERIDSQEEGSYEGNWATNNGEIINGKAQDGNPIYGTPKNPNSEGIAIISYPSFDDSVADLKNRLGNEEELREKLILVLRQDKNLEKMLKSKEALKYILTGESSHLKKLLSQEEVLRILLENKDNLSLLCSDPRTKELFKELLNIEEDEWEDFLASLPEATTNLKLIKEFRRDLLWVLDAGDLMRECQEDAISYDQLRTPELADIKIKEVPEWEDIKKELSIIDPETGPTEGPDPTIFYCRKPLW